MRETDAKNKLDILQAFNPWTMKFTKNILVNFIIQELKFCKIAQHFCVSVSLVRENLGELRENKKHKNQA